VFDSTAFLCYAAALVVCDLALGFALGWSTRGAAAGFIERRAHARQALQGLKRLHDLTDDVATRVGRHMSRIEEVSRELVTMRATCREPKDRAVIDAVTEIVVINEDLTRELAEARMQLQEQADTIRAQAAASMTDLVTGLPNRKSFDDELARRIAQYQQQDTPLSVVLVDLDNLSQLHAEHGKQATDEVLARVASLLTETVRAMDLVARYAEDQFAVLLPGTKLEDAQSAAERLRQAVSAHDLFVGDLRLQLTVTEGVAEASPSDDARSLLKRSGDALASAHAAGGGCAHVNQLGKCHPIQPKVEEVEVPDDLEHRERELQRVLGKVDPATPDAYTDALTGLLNRRGFFEGLRARLSDHRIRKSSLCLLAIDVDNLRQLNDSRGQLAGDVVLRTVAQVLRAATRVHFDVVSRYEGPKLAAVLVETPLAEGLMIAERIRRATQAAKLRAEGTELRMSVSVGVVEATHWNDPVSAKLAGRNRTHYHDGIRVQSLPLPAAVA
jgi:diguanylate cyclase (GGDEF)-like protein